MSEMSSDSDPLDHSARNALAGSTLAALAALARSAPADIVETYALTRVAEPARMIGANALGPTVKSLLDRAFVTI